MKIAARRANLTRIAALAAIAAVLPALSACSGANLADAAPDAALQPGYATQPDGYPNLNVAPLAATNQIDDAERAALAAELETARRAQAGGPTAAAARAEQARLRRLARSHAGAKLTQIEATQGQ